MEQGAFHEVISSMSVSTEWDWIDSGGGAFLLCDEDGLGASGFGEPGASASCRGNIEWSRLHFLSKQPRGV